MQRCKCGRYTNNGVLCTSCSTYVTRVRDSDYPEYDEDNGDEDYESYEEDYEGEN